MGDVPARTAVPTMRFDAGSIRLSVPGGSADAHAEPAQKVMFTAFFGRPMVAVTRPVAGSTRWTPPSLPVPHSEPAPTAVTSGTLVRVRVTAPVAGLMRLTDPLLSPLVTHSAPKPATIHPPPVPTRIGGPLTWLVAGLMRNTTARPALGSFTQTRL